MTDTLSVDELLEQSQPLTDELDDPTTATGDDQPVIPPRRPLPKRRRRLDKYGYYEPRPEGSASTTRQGEGLNVAITRRSKASGGVINGVDATSNSPMFLDQFAAYGEETSSINVVVIGDIGKGKTSYVTTSNITRQLPLGRQVIVFDKKLQSGVGEYTNVAQATGADSVVFTTGTSGGPRLNLLDPVISMRGEHAAAQDRPEGQVDLVGAVIEDMIGRTMTSIERLAVNGTLEVVTEDARADGRDPVIGEVADRMMFPKTDDFARYGVYEKEAMFWGREPAAALRELSGSALKGLLDEPTTDDVRAALDHPFVHFDISRLPTASTALRVVMTTTNTWLANRCAARSTRFRKTTQIFEEGWDVANGSTGRLVQANMKLSRGLALSTVSAFHHLSDIPTNSPARALMREASIVILYAQERYEDALEVSSMYHLPPGSAEILMRLRRGQCVVVVSGQEPRLMQHLRSPLEVELTNSDAAITGRHAAA